MNPYSTLRGLSTRDDATGYFSNVRETRNSGLTVDVKEFLTSRLQLRIAPSSVDN